MLTPRLASPLTSMLTFTDDNLYSPVIVVVLRYSIIYKGLLIGIHWFFSVKKLSPKIRSQGQEKHKRKVLPA